MQDTDLVRHLLLLSQWLKALESQSHIVHLNYVGNGNFITVHLYLKERYEEHLEQLDSAAEFVRALGARFLGTVAELQELPSGFNDIEVECGCDQMLATYGGNLQNLIRLAQSLEPLAADARAIDVANWCAELVASSSKAVWFLRSTLGSPAAES